MSVENALAGVAVKDLQVSGKWYQQLIGQPGSQPMPEVFEWSLPSGGGLQVFVDDKRAGASSITFAVKDLESHVNQLSERGIEIGERTHSDKVSTAIIKDPDGNQVVLAEAHSDQIAK